MSNGQIFICQESAMVPLEDVDGNEVPTLFREGKTTVREGHLILDRWPELFKPMNVTYDLDDDAPEPASRGGVIAAARAAAGNRSAKKAAAKKATPAAKKAAAKKAATQVKQDSPSTVPASASDLSKTNTPTPPAGHAGNTDPAGENGPDGGVAKGTEAPALTDDPKQL